MDEFPLCGHMVSDEYEQLSSEGEGASLETVSLALTLSLIDNVKHFVF